MLSMNPDKIESIKQLRSQGFSIPEISQSLGVSKTTVLRYIKNVEILPEYFAEWAGKRGGSKKRRVKLEEEALAEGKKFVRNLTTREKLLFLCALYWAEGNKKDFILTNTDPDIIRIFVDGLRSTLNISDERFKISIRIYEDLDKDRCLDYWSKVTRVKKERFLNVNILPGKKKGKLEYGMCRVRIAKGGHLLKKFIGINKSVSKEFMAL
jgi:hypothetical protein